ncbi:hypothetical protein VP01_2276g1 [Puccinia sorghi]|uniref:Uncharacterized protein n=1 Tax=Puccinia sorghi TaxID=27349 RepID=A0A0L6VA26_9BASI|nr:hypothetical protein VP01_2276g1 [Puccinia sorghi]
MGEVHFLFLLGMPETAWSYPNKPSEQEISLWAERRRTLYDRLKEHMETYETLAEFPKADITPPPFSSSPNVKCTNFKIPFTTKLACEKDIQLACFGRITFQWHAKSFTCLNWNASLPDL